MPKIMTGPQSVPCPLCGARAGHPCIWKGSRRTGVASSFHYERVVRARVAERNPDATRKRVAREMFRP